MVISKMNKWNKQMKFTFLNIITKRVPVPWTFLLSVNRTIKIRILLNFYSDMHLF